MRRRVGLAAGVGLSLVACFFLIKGSARGTSIPTSAPVATHPEVSISPLPDIWQVEQSAEFDTYSNGLRIDNRFAVANHARSYLAFPVDKPDEAGSRRDQPVGIVFHTTESQQAPFEARQNGALKRIGESLVEYVRRQQSYNFLIDRFGRVFRIVRETDAANHAGYSIWADEEWLYLNLNESFLGVSFEAHTEPGQITASVSTAQVRSAAMLTEMLRWRYSIPAANCVTHAQVSVNPDNMRVGYHTDWASSFPFERLGLPDNYSRALPAILEFGFSADSTFLHTGGTRLHAGVELAEEQLQLRAEAGKWSVPALRKALERRYRSRLAQTRRGGAGEAEAKPAGN